MNARIEQITARNARNFFAMGLSQEEVARREYLATLQELMLITEYLDRVTLELPCNAYTSFTLYGEIVTIVRYSGLDIQIFEGRNEWESVTALANAAAEYALECGFVYANYLQ